MAAKKGNSLKFVFCDGAAVAEFRRSVKMNQGPFWGRVFTTQSAGSRYENGREMPKSVMIALQIAYGTEKQASEMVSWLRQPGNAGEVSS